MSIDFFIVPTIQFRLLFVLVVLAHARRQVIHLGFLENVWVNSRINLAVSRASSGFQGLGQGLEIWHDFSMSTPKKSKRLLDAYRFAGFRPLPALVRGVR